MPITPCIRCSMYFMVWVCHSDSATTIICTRTRSAAFVLANCYPTLNQKQNFYHIPDSYFTLQTFLNCLSTTRHYSTRTTNKGPVVLICITQAAGNAESTITTNSNTVFRTEGFITVYVVIHFPTFLTTCVAAYFTNGRTPRDTHQKRAALNVGTT